MGKIENGRNQIFRYKANILQLNDSKRTSYKQGLTGRQRAKLYTIDNQ
jgi:hypothetical protein